jgi:predicted nucleic-acid-binding protein
VRITADTNLLVRALTQDDAQQADLAQAAFAEAEIVAVTLPALCELVWVLAKGYDIKTADIAAAVGRPLDAANVVANRPAAEAGFAQLRAGGDFADGVIAHERRWLGANTFVSCDERAVRLLEAQGQAVRLLA